MMLGDFFVHRQGGMFGMKKFTFILGGVRSGKSGYALNMAKSISDDVLYIATSTFEDEEMRERIKRHRDSRPASWGLIEEGLDIGKALRGADEKYEVIIVDCLGVFISNLLCNDLSDAEIEERGNDLAEAIRGSEADIIVVSNEVGCGLVPDNPLGRQFRDLVGLANQMMAKEADEVVFMQAGIPVTIKGRG